MSIKDKIDQHLNTMFNFKRVGEWYRYGVCPQCNKKELYTHALNPRVVKCSRLNKCGYEEHIKDLCSDLFKDWSKDFPRTETNPKAAADAYLTYARGFDITELNGLYTQELFRNDYKFPDQVSATVRFKLSDTVFWERLIDRPERFGHQKANIIGEYKGLHWSKYSLKELAQSEEIWLVEGIFDAIALHFVGIKAISTISCGNYPNVFFEQLKNYCQNELKISSYPTLVWAFDNDKAGKSAVLKFHKKALEEGFNSTAVLPLPEQDWNDLYERQLFSEQDLRKYRHFGQLHIAETAKEAAMLIYRYYDERLSQFYFYHKLRTYWFKMDREEYEKQLDSYLDNCATTQEAIDKATAAASKLEEICNATFHALYFQRDSITDTAHYYFQIQSDNGIIQDTFSPEQLTSKANFTNRLLSVSAGSWWKGTEKQLQTIAQRETEKLKEVKTIDYIGYSKEYKTYVFDTHAVHNGRVIAINSQDYYRAGRNDLKTLARQPRIILNDEPFKATWWQDCYAINGEKGLIILAWWTGAYFAEQIRQKQASYPFMEYVGQAGSGKSSYLEFLWRLSGRNDKKEGLNPNSSSVAAIHRSMAQVSNLPVVFIEGDRKNEKARHKFDWDELKDAFNGQNIRSRGLKTQSNDTYEPPFRGAILISQNDHIKASEAILSRTLHISVDTSGHSYEKKLIANRLYSIESEEACKYMTHCLKNEDNILNLFFAKTAEIEREYHQKHITHTRITLCHAQISAMIDALAEYVLKDYITAEQVHSAKQLLEKMAIQRIADLSADHSLVQQFWEVYEYLDSISTEAFKINHYPSDSPYIAINLNEFYKAALRNHQSLADINEMRDLLKSSRIYKFVEMNKQVRTKHYPTDKETEIVTDNSVSRNLKCWIFKKPT